MKKLFITLLFIGCSSLLYAQIQDEILNEVEVLGVHFKYLDAVDQEQEAQSVKNIHKKVGDFEIFASELYDYPFGKFSYTFEIPEGKILATYDIDGNLLTTIEKFKNIKLPLDVSRTLITEYPGWTFEKTFFTIDYHYETGVNKKYKVIISKDGKKKRVVLSTEGEFL